jgi:hypothetical protein
MCATGTTALLACGGAAGLLFIVANAIEIPTRGGFDIRRHAISMLSLGNGPAIDLSFNDASLFTCEPVRASVSAHAEQLLTLTAVGAGSTYTMQFEAPLAYFDIEGVQWLTTVGVDLDRTGGPESRIVRHETKRA